MVKAETLELEALVEALKAGRYYSSHLLGRRLASGGRIAVNIARDWAQDTTLMRIADFSMRASLRRF